MADSTGLSSPSEIQSPDMLLAEQGLLEALKESVDITEKLERLIAIRKKLQAHVGAIDLVWERRRFFEQNMEGYFAWASGEGKFPSSKQLDSIENDAKIAQLALSHVEFRMVALDAAAKMNLSEQLVNRARILTLRGREEDLRTARALDTMRGELGHPEGLLILGGPSQKLEAEADLLTVQAAALRRESETQILRLKELEKEGQHGR